MGNYIISTLIIKGKPEEIDMFLKDLEGVNNNLMKLTFKCPWIVEWARKVGGKYMIVDEEQMKINPYEEKYLREATESEVAEFISLGYENIQDFVKKEWNNVACIYGVDIKRMNGNEASISFFTVTSHVCFSLGYKLKLNYPKLGFYYEGIDEYDDTNFQLWEFEEEIGELHPQLIDLLKELRGLCGLIRWVDNATNLLPRYHEILRTLPGVNKMAMRNMKGIRFTVRVMDEIIEFSEFRSRGLSKSEFFEKTRLELVLDE